MPGLTTGQLKQRKTQSMKLQRLNPMLISFVCIALLPAARAVVPPPDGDYPGRNTAEGHKALFSLTMGTDNTALGWLSLQALTTGSLNTGVGAWTLALNTADNNTAVGTAAMLLNTSGHDNVANGTATLVNNDDGSYNTATGAFALYLNTSGTSNAATGTGALQNNTIGNYNVANGGFALFFNNNGSHNTAIGDSALYSNDSGSHNTAVGDIALNANETGTSNTAIGQSALLINTAGTDNTAIGDSALANATGSNSIAIGSQAGSSVGSSNNVIAIGSPGDDVDNSCFIGNIRDVQTQNANGIAVLVDSAGQLGTVSSSRRFKKEIKPMDKTSQAVLALKPVTFQYKKDTKGIPQFGLVAEDVAEVNPDLVVRDKNGEIYSVRYDAVNAMLLNEFLKEHKKVQDLESRLAQQEHQIERLSAGLQKVSAQLETSRPVPQLVVSDR
jgi:Chaperone of endosialidase